MKKENLKFSIDELNQLELTKVKGGKRDGGFTGAGCSVNNNVSGCACAAKGNSGK